MNKRNIDQGAEIRLFDINQAALYIGMGQTKAREYLEKMGAKISFGRIVRYDKRIIDEVIDKQLGGEVL